MNTTESFSAILERTKKGVFHYLSKKHISRYLDEFTFRWDNRIPEDKITRRGIKKIVMRPMPVMDIIVSLLAKAAGKQLLRTHNGSIISKNFQLAADY